MTRSYAQIVKQIETLKQEAEKARRKEIEGVVGRIREAITVYGLTADDLGFGAKALRSSKAGDPAKKRGRKTTKAAKPVGVVKYRNETGSTWVGRGKRPQWLRDALAGGKQLSDFAVK
jgi:DNA-binding protein H-NS